jgi:glutathione peroxidase
MTIRQQLLKWLYPVFKRLMKKTGEHGKIAMAPQLIDPPGSFHQLSARLNNGQDFSFDALRGKKVLLVNTASDCGYTAQYAELETLRQSHPDSLVILGFPANDFKEQEKADDAAIATFCSVNYGVQFPIFHKSIVVPGVQQHPVFQWLTNPDANGWNRQAPVWNFSKYLVDEKGRLIAYFGPAVTPGDATITSLL